MQIVTRNRLLWMTEGERWADVTATSDELFNLFFEQARLPSSQAQVLPLGQRRLEVFA